MDSSRVLIAVILSLGLIFAYQELVLKRLYPPPPSGQTAIGTAQSTAAGPGANAESTLAGAGTQGAAQPAPAVSAGVSSAPAAAASSAAPAASALAGSGAGGAPKSITIDTSLYTAVLTTLGGRLESFKLKRYNASAAPGSGAYQMVPQNDARYPLAVTLARDGKLVNDSALDYTCGGPETIEVPAAASAKIDCVVTAADGTRIDKALEFRGGSYAFAMNIGVSGGPKLDGIGLAMSEPMAAHEGYRDVPAVQAYVQGKVISDYEATLKKGAPPATGKITYAGFGDRYFLAAYLPRTPSQGVLTIALEPGDNGFARILFGPSPTLSADVYMGPKLLEALETVDPALNKSIDFGYSGIIALPFLRVLKLFHLFAPNWGWDIVLMTLALRVLLLPMSIKSQRSMMKMQRLAPQMEKIREKFKDDNERQQREMVDLYKRNHVNPIGGCLPMAVQFPIFIGLYEALLNAVELRHAPFILWIRDLSAPDCFPLSWMPKLPLMQCHGLPVLVLLMGASTFLQQWMAPTSPDPNQQRMMMLTPIIFTVMFVNFPAGLSLYYFSSNVLGVVQQIVLNREFKTYSPVPA
ncbi:MAG TPA: membrane protein insertase YidC [Candidatus Binataceae bacterium]|nr:membrane protein insertase YidC [Candidatus Binataceae bacterium]